MKNIFLLAASIMLSTSYLYAVETLPYTFTSGTTIKAEDVNSNFTYLLERFGTRKTTVNCSGGESITTALQNYNHIVISGICTENLDLDGTTLSHRLVILEGSSSSSDGITAKDTSNPAIQVSKGLVFKASKLKLSAGTNGFKANRGPTVILENLLVENNTSAGIALWMGSDAIIKDSTIQNNGAHGIIAGYSSSVSIQSNTISGHSNDASILIFGSSAAFIVANTITGGKFAGIDVGGSSYAQIGYTPVSGVSQGNSIQSSKYGIKVRESSHAKIRYNTVNNNTDSGLRIESNASVALLEGNTFSSNTYGIYLWQSGNLHMWCDAQLTSETTISGNTSSAIKVNNGGTISICNLNLSSPNEGVSLFQADQAYLYNVTITSSSTYGLRVYGTNVDFDNSTISGSTNAEIQASYSTINLENTAITGIFGSNEIELKFGSNLFIDTGTTITGTVYCDASVDNNSIGNWANLTLTTSGC
ncbi:MAG: right-handed parallel beta-helix repeat-containing protein [Candidatus Marinimicrobia bacterium]|nr:right-handed parallel beta-helix repeat-containing protein [Candidatus Neomarinimicrobiota bacterium]